MITKYRPHDIDTGYVTLNIFIGIDEILHYMFNKIFK